MNYNNDDSSTILTFAGAFLVGLMVFGFLQSTGNSAQAAKGMTRAEIRDYRQRQKEKRAKLEQDRVAAEKVVNARNARERKNRYGSGYAEARMQELERMKLEKDKAAEIKKNTVINDRAKEVVYLYNSINLNKQQIKKLQEETLILENRLADIARTQYNINDPNLPQLNDTILEDIAKVKKDIDKAIEEDKKVNAPPIFIDLSVE